MTALLLGLALVAAFLVARWLKQTVLKGAAPPTLEGLPLVGGVVKFARVRECEEKKRGAERSLSRFLTCGCAGEEVVPPVMRGGSRAEAGTHACARKARAVGATVGGPATRGAAAQLTRSSRAGTRPTLAPIRVPVCLADRISRLAA